MENVKVRSNTKVDTRAASKELDKAVFFTLSAVAIGFGIFAFASLIGGAMSVGLPGLFKSWMVAVGLV